MRASLHVDDLAEWNKLPESGLEGGELAVAMNEFLRDYADPDTVVFADLVKEAQKIADPNEQVTKLVEAAKAREDAAWVLPATWDAITYLVQPRIDGFTPRPSPERAYYKYIHVSD